MSFGAAVPGAGAGVPLGEADGAGAEGDGVVGAGLVVDPGVADAVGDGLAVGAASPVEPVPVSPAWPQPIKAAETAARMRKFFMRS
jgi:hypothetical protein